MSGIRGCKADSGAEKRKRKKMTDQIILLQKGAILGHFKRVNKNEKNCCEAENETESISVESGTEQNSFHQCIEISNSSPMPDNSNLEMKTHELETSLMPENQNQINLLNIDLGDIGLWPLSLTKNQHRAIIETGPKRIIELEFPRDENNRHFSASFYTRKLPNGETVDRRWLVYSKQKDAAFCFCCRLFSESKTKFCCSGSSDWKNFSKLLKKHESSTKHIHSLHKWLEYENRLTKHSLIDKDFERIIDAEKQHWHGVLERLLAIVQFLTRNNLAFRGTHEKVFEKNNGNFLGIVELMAKFDPVLREHLRRITNSEISNHYLGKNIQNEFIQLIQDNVLKTIVNSVNKAKYFSIILDCTPDISHQEQMSMILRFVHRKGKTFEIVERFVGFLAVNETTGKGLLKTVLENLEKLDLEIDNLCGQGYDNGSNMRGHKQGLQARILDINPRAFYVPCGCHNLNLVLSDMAKTSVYAKTLFGIIQQIYVFFSSSTQRWHILLTHVNLTVKPLCETRWESRIESIRALRYQIGEIYDALVEASETTNDVKSQTESISLAKEIKTYKFLVMLCVWHDVLSQVNLVSKLMQSQNITVNESLKLLEKINHFLNEYRDSGFEKAKIAAKELAEELEINPEEMKFPPKISARKKCIRKQFLYESNDAAINDPEDHFRINYFNTLLDQAIMSIDERFRQYDAFKENFGFLFNFAQLKNEGDSYLKDRCINMQNILTLKNDNTKSDIDGMNLFTELKTLTNIVANDTDMSPLSCLEYLLTNRLDEVFPNLVILLRIFLTIPVTVASAERSFSKLKLIKTYLRSTMSQEKLSGIAVLSIENDIASSIDYAELIKEFARKKARKITL